MTIETPASDYADLVDKVADGLHDRLAKLKATPSKRVLTQLLMLSLVDAGAALASSGEQPDADDLLPRVEDLEGVPAPDTDATGNPPYEEWEKELRAAYAHADLVAAQATYKGLLDIARMAHDVAGRALDALDRIQDRQSILELGGF